MMRWIRNSGWVAMSVVVLISAGCGQSRSVNQEVIDVKGQYDDLANRSVAIVVSMSDFAEFNHPNAKQAITEEMARRVQANVPGVTLTSPSSGCGSEVSE